VKTAENEETTNNELEIETGEENGGLPENNGGEATENEGEQTGEQTGGDYEGSEVVVSIGDEASPASNEDETKAPEWVRELRKNYRTVEKENRELREKLNAVTGATQKPVELGKKPTLEECDYDAERFERELEAWHNRKLEAEQQERKKKDEAEAANRAWQATLEGYGKAKGELKVKDFDDAEDIVKDTLSVTQQGIILQGCKNPALVVYALGKNPKKAKELASITDPVKYAFAVANLENQLKVTNRKAAPPPEKTVRSTGGAAVSGTVDSTLERLRTEAEKTGDYSKVHAYKQQQRNKGK
jgi:hypothetical protein